MVPGLSAIQALIDIGKTRKYQDEVKSIANRILAAFVPLMMLVLAVETPAKVKWSDHADERKADYLFMEAQRQNALGNSDAYYELMERSYELDSSSSDVGFLLGYYKLMVAGEDSVTFNRGYNMLRRHFDEKPGDIYSSFMYGNLNTRMGNHDEALRVWTRVDSLYPDKSEVSVKLAEALSQSTDTADLRHAIAVLDRVERSEGKMIPLSTRKIRNYYALGDTAAIIGEVHGLMASSPGSSDYNIFAGDIYSILQHGDSAIYYYDRACELDSANGPAFYARANYYKELGDSAAYDREVFKALKVESLDLDSKLQLLTGYIRELYSDSTQHQRIEDLFKVLLDQHPHEPDIRDLYCSYLIAVEDYGRAAEQARFVLDADPSAEERWRAMMSLYIQAEDYPKAIQAGEDALRYHPHSPMINLLSASCYMTEKDYGPAMDKLNAALAVADTTDVETLSSIYGTIGDVYYATQQPDSAYRYYDKALELNEANLLTLNNYAYYLAEQGRDLDRAETMSAITIKQNPENGTALDTYAWILFKKKDYERAKEYIDEAIRVEPSPTAELWEHAGDIYFMCGDPDKALEFWKKALALDPDSEMLQRKVRYKTYFYK